jgi:mannose-1-phosphate guanylyltransferase
MTAADHLWVVILTAGRNEHAAESSGLPINVRHRRCTEHELDIVSAVQFARRLVARERTCALVDSQHRRDGWRLRAMLGPSNLIEEPMHRGPAAGILWATLNILSRDPFARILFLPAESVRVCNAAPGAAIPDILTYVSSHALEIVLAGLRTVHTPSLLGLATPGARLPDGTYKVRHLVESSTTHAAHSFRDGSALHNTVAIAGWGLTILGLFRESLPTIVADLGAALARDSALGSASRTVHDVYARLPALSIAGTFARGARLVLRLVSMNASGLSGLELSASNTVARPQAHSS